MSVNNREVLNQEKFDLLIEKHVKLKEKCAKLEAEIMQNPVIDELKLKLESVTNENKNLLSMFDELTTQFESQAQELNDESNSRALLVSAIQKLYQMVNYLGTEIESINKRNNELITQVDSLQTKLQRYMLPSLLLEEIESLKTEIVTIVPSKFNETVKKIMYRETLSYPERILEVVTLLSQQKFICHEMESKPDIEIKYQKLLKDYELMRSIIYSNVRFISDIVDSREKLNWILQPTNVPEARKLLLLQDTRIKKYLEEQGIDPTSDRSLFDILMIDTSDIDFKIQLSTCLDIPIETQTEKTLFTLLLQAVLANHIIRKFAVESRIQCNQQVIEIKDLQYQYNYLNDIYQNHIDDEHLELNAKLKAESERNDKLEEMVSKVKNLVKNILSDSGTLQNINDLIDSIDTMDSLTLNKDSQISEMLHMIKEKSEQTGVLNESLKRFTDENKLLKKKLHKIFCSYEEIQRKCKEEIELLEMKLREQEENYESINEKLKSDNKSLVDENRELRKIIDRVKEEYEENLSKLENKNNELSKDKKTQQNIFNQEIQKVAKSNYKEMEKVKDIFLEKRKKLRTMLKVERAKLEELKTNSENTIDLLKNKIEKLTESNNELTENLTNMQMKLLQLNSKINNMTVENKMLNTRIAGREEKMKRERSLLESQLKMKMLSYETDCQAKIDQSRSIFRRREAEFISDILKIFPPEKFVESNDMNDKTVTFEGIIDILSKVSERLALFHVTANQLDQSKSELSACRKLLVVPSNLKLEDSIKQLLEIEKNRKDEISKLEENIRSMRKEVIEARAISQQVRCNKDWEDWARKLNMLATGGPSFSRSPSEIRFAVEEIVFSALGNRLVWRRLDSLRTQKKLILLGACKVVSKTSTFKSLIVLSQASRRIQKLSGHVQCIISLTRKTTPDTVELNLTGADKKPLFTSFVLHDQKK